ncbi:MAG: ATPase, T2SS/T4P/T4SS family [Planctomycetota bacterium]
MIRRKPIGEHPEPPPPPPAEAATQDPTAVPVAAPKPTAQPKSAAPRLGDLLVEQGLVTEEHVRDALSTQKRTGKMLGEALVDEGIIQTGTLVRTLARSLGLRGCQVRHGLADPTLLSLLGEDEARRLKVLPLFRVRDTLTLAMAEPQSLPTIDRVRQITGLQVRPVLALESNIVEFIQKYAGGNTDVDEFLTSLAETDVSVVEGEGVEDGPAADLDQMVAGSPIINLVNVALLTAIRDGASDVHIEPARNGTRVRYRIDGLLRDLMKPPPGMHPAIVSRVKVIGKMNIAERRLPQEGRVRIVAEGREVDLRVSSIPTLLGEKLVIRVLDRANLKLDMADLGFHPESLEAFQRMLKRPHGLVLVTGPTGSGKTTTLYSALDLLRSPERNLVTVEDPVEYQLDLINQILVQEQVGLTFARALRSILRQDPDVIMVGEIRDQETARVAVQAALTGHLVLATLHTNSAAGAVARLGDMGVEPYLIASALNGVLAQRLARTLCSACAANYFPEDELMDHAGLSDHRGKPLRKGMGCQECHNSGYRGRLGVYEVLEVDLKLRRMIHRCAATHEIERAWIQQGGRALQTEACRLALEGRTDLEEALRISANEDVEAEEPLPGDGVAVEPAEAPPVEEAAA